MKAKDRIKNFLNFENWESKADISKHCYLSRAQLDKYLTPLVLAGEILRKTQPTNNTYGNPHWRYVYCLAPISTVAETLKIEAPEIEIPLTPAPYSKSQCTSTLEGYEASLNLSRLLRKR